MNWMVFGASGRIAGVPHRNLGKGVIHITPLVGIGGGRSIWIDQIPMRLDRKPRDRRIVQQSLVKTGSKAASNSAGVMQGFAFCCRAM